MQQSYKAQKWRLSVVAMSAVQPYIGTTGCVYKATSNHTKSLQWASELSLRQPNLHICITSSQFRLLAVLVLHLWSHWLVIFSMNNRSLLLYASPSLWNQPPTSLRQLHTNLSHSKNSPVPMNTSSIHSPFSPSITHSFFYSRLKSVPFHDFFLRSLLFFFFRTDSTDCMDCYRDFWVYPFCG